MKKNDIVITDIISFSSEGYGIGKIDEYVLFVPYTCTGDKVKVKIINVKKNILFCKVEEFIEKSDSHSEPSCGSYKQCGGCTLLHINYNKQLEFKKTKVEDAIRRIGKLDVKVHDVCPSDCTGYRNKTLIPVGLDKNGKITCGFFRRKSHDIIDMDNCIIQDKSADEICKAVISWMYEYDIKPYDFKTNKGIVRHIYIRKAFSSGKMMAGVVANADKLPFEKELAEKLAENPDVVSVICNVNKKATNVILGEKTNILYGEEYLEDTLLDKTFKIGSLSFYQINRNQTENLYSKAKELLKLTENDVLYDIYCGIGTIGICIGDNVKKIIGVEIIPEAVELAKENALLNGIINSEYFVGKAENMSFPDNEKPTAVVIDPPRKGCDKKMIDTLLELSPEKICYISCDPATLARDLKIFSESGKYKIGDVYPFDMFPNTEHVEAVVLLQQLSLPDGK